MSRVTPDVFRASWGTSDPIFLVDSGGVTLLSVSNGTRTHTESVLSRLPLPIGIPRLSSVKQLVLRQRYQKL